MKDNSFIGIVLCGHCGSIFWRKRWNSTYENFKRRVLQCNRKYEKKGEVRCKNKHIVEEILYKAFVNSFNVLIENRGHFIKKWKAEEGNELNRYRAQEFTDIITDDSLCHVFNIDLFFKMVEKMAVFKDEKLIVSFLDGTEVEHWTIKIEPVGIRSVVLTGSIFVFKG